MYAGSVLHYMFNREPLHLPFDAGLGCGARAHAPDEFFAIEGNERVAGLEGCEKSFVVMLDTSAEYEF